MKFVLYGQPLHKTFPLDSSTGFVYHVIIASVMSQYVGNCVTRNFKIIEVRYF
jgi:hypothetical protein